MGRSRGKASAQNCARRAVPITVGAPGSHRQSSCPCCLFATSRAVVTRSQGEWMMGLFVHCSLRPQSRKNLELASTRDWVIAATDPRALCRMAKVYAGGSRKRSGSMSLSRLFGCQASGSCSALEPMNAPGHAMRDYPIDSAAHDLVALACHGFEPRPIDLKLATSIGFQRS